jgi:hypothetical protein
MLDFSSEDGRSKITNGSKRGNVHYAGNQGIIYANADNNVVMHETGHLVGLADRYDDVDMLNYGEKESYPHEGYKNDLMGSSRNNKLIKDHYWDYIREYGKIPARYNHIRGVVEVGRTPQSGKLKTRYEKGGTHRRRTLNDVINGK